MIQTRRVDVHRKHRHCDYRVAGDVIREVCDGETYYYWHDDADVYEATGAGDMSEVPLRDYDRAAWIRECGDATAAAAWAGECQ